MSIDGKFIQTSLLTNTLDFQCNCRHTEVLECFPASSWQHPPTATLREAASGKVTSGKHTGKGAVMRKGGQITHTRTVSSFPALLITSSSSYCFALRSAKKSHLLTISYFLTSVCLSFTVGKTLHDLLIS